MRTKKQLFAGVCFAFGLLIWLSMVYDLITEGTPRHSAFPIINGGLILFIVLLALIRDSRKKNKQ